jgi:hypothetical protein
MSSYSKQVSFKFAKSQWLLALLAAAHLAACDSGLGPIKSLDDAKLQGSVSAPAAQSVPQAWYDGELPILRFQMDTARERGWILTRMGVLVFDIKSRQTMRYIPLPGWHWAGEPFGAAPDLALGPAGDALISSDILPTLWRVDAATLRVSTHELVLDEDGDKDVGFSGLAYSAQHGAIFAVSYLHGSLWRIDPLLRRGQKIALSAPLAGAGALSVLPRVDQRKTALRSGLCARTLHGNWAIHLAPDQRAGYVVAQPCTG